MFSFHFARSNMCVNTFVRQVVIQLAYFIQYSNFCGPTISALEIGRETKRIDILSIQKRENDAVFRYDSPHSLSQTYI